KCGHDTLELTTQIEATVLHAAKDLLGRWRADSAGVRRLEHLPVRGRRRCQLAQPIVGKAKEGQRPRVDAKRFERRPGFMFPDERIRLIVARGQVSAGKTGAFCARGAPGEAVTARGPDHLHTAATVDDASYQSAGAEHTVIRVRRDDEQARRAG